MQPAHQQGFQSQQQMPIPEQSQQQTSTFVEIQQQQACAPQAPVGWTEDFFYPDGRKTPAFDALMKAFFTRLDKQGTGYITPEQYSSFLDACQYLTEWNPWKKNLQAAWVYTAEDIADHELKAVFEGFYFDHKVVLRNPANQQLTGGGMPLLSLEGLTEHMALEWASDPDDHLRGINNALVHYGVWPERGPIPRHVFPAFCPPQLQARIDAAMLRCAANAKTKINASAVKLQLQALGEQNAIELADDRRWRTEYRYY
ncbi:hypothetical protein HDU86_006549 [Geranomyces michiganensis]|nr:hypothetical protein HDU86_006549 [Geranomyces michiganensis]